MRHIIKYKFLKLYVKIRNYVNKLGNKRNYKITEPQRLALDITEKLLSNKHSVLLISPLSGKRYLELYDDLVNGRGAAPETFIVITYDRISIINHKYYYDLEISTHIYSKISVEFDRETERRRRKMEKEIMDNIVTSLSDIKESL